MPDFTGPLPCKRCKGSGIMPADEFSPERKCYACNGAGSFQPPDVKALIEAIQPKRKGTRSCVCSHRPEDDRAYFVWRLVRFHSGEDVTLPMTAFSAVIGDPFEPVLDRVAELYAAKVRGHGSAGRARWRGALGGTYDTEPGMPVSAESAGPVLLGSTPKPDMELGEL